jgi:diguanylate cyclase (GGDEF)-like protein
MRTTRSKSESGSQNHWLHREVLPINRGAGPVKASLEETLSSVLQATDSELRDMLHEIDEISHTLRSHNPDKRTLKAASHPTLWAAVKQTLLERELRNLALTDDLTCMYNRRGFFAAATQLLKVASRNGQSLLLFFCDLDNLKRINDTFGHSEGDLALLRTADAMERAFRAADLLARLGDDEFVVLALEAANGQEIMLRRFEKALKEANLGESRFQLSVSIGVAQFDPNCAVPLSALISQATKAMYQEKERRLAAVRI